MNHSERRSNGAFAFVLLLAVLAFLFSSLGCATKRTTVYLPVTELKQPTNNVDGANSDR